MQELNERQAAIHTFVWEHYSQHQTWPTLTQIAANVGLAHHHNVTRDIGRIAWLGFALPPRPRVREQIAT